ncbi:hypothetical protein GWI33_022226 [Rhynchophorus ferrugineus]|uniref:Uncharacterized protein n=1 Tax=Rhynchophorus ferrugineus TaxID=354439 RepID=A0A834HS37_RHYFE|nr:hypothetical protein GWI33_022226 [Rhynchophorus ferrugineus]
MPFKAVNIVPSSILETAQTRYVTVQSNSTCVAVFGEIKDNTNGRKTHLRRGNREAPPPPPPRAVAEPVKKKDGIRELKGEEGKQRHKVPEGTAINMSGGLENRKYMNKYVSLTFEFLVLNFNQAADGQTKVGKANDGIIYS